MNVRFYLILLLCSSHLSCASYVRLHDSPGLTYKTLNKKLSGREVEITLVDGQVFSVADVTIAEDSTSWRDIHKNSLVRRSTDSIHRLTIYKRRTVDGLLLGLVSGFATGAVIGYRAGEDCNRGEEDCIDRETTAGLLGTLLALPGLLIGTAAGAGSKKPTHFIVNPSTLPD